MDRTRTVPIAPESPIAELRNASSGERLLGLYSHAVSACGDRDRDQVIAALEERLGARLLQRTTRSVTSGD